MKKLLKILRRCTKISLAIAFLFHGSSIAQEWKSHLNFKLSANRYTHRDSGQSTFATMNLSSGAYWLNEKKEKSRFSLIGDLSLTKEFSNDKKWTLDDFLIRSHFPLREWNKRLFWLGSFNLTLPTSKESRKNNDLILGLGATSTLQYVLSKKPSWSFSSISWGLSLKRYFHKYTHLKSGSPNTHTVLSNQISLQTKLLKKMRSTHGAILSSLFRHSEKILNQIGYFSELNYPLFPFLDLSVGFETSRDLIDPDGQGYSQSLRIIDTNRTFYYFKSGLSF